MLLDDFDLAYALELNHKNAAKICDGLLDKETLEAELWERRPFDRKGLCQYLGISESTLSGWLKEDRISLMAKEAFVLLRAVNLLQNEIARLKEEAEDLKILRTGDEYQICIFRENEEGAVVGSVMAEGIKSFKHARLMAESLKSQRMLSEAHDLINEMLERTENDEYIRYLKNFRDRVISSRKFIFDYEWWSKYLGSKELEIDLSALGDSDQGETEESEEPKDKAEET